MELHEKFRVLLALRPKKICPGCPKHVEQILEEK